MADLKSEDASSGTQLEINKDIATAVSQKQMRRWSVVILIASLLFILYSTLFPFDFFSNWPLSFSGKVHSLSFNLDDMRGFGENVLLFIPLGFSLTGLLRARDWGRPLAILLALVAGLTLSLLVEMTQTYSTVRSPALTDVAANALGAVLGTGLFLAWGFKLVRYGAVQTDRLRPYLTQRYLTMAAAGYLALMLALTLFLHRLTSLANWDADYPLLLGNELTGNRAWQGTLSQVFIADKVFSEAEIGRLFSGEAATAVSSNALLVYQDFTNGGGSGNFPDMTWQDEPAWAEDGSGVVLGRRHWLKSNAPVTELSQRLAHTSQFTLGVVMTPGRLDQRGPARIVSISQDTNHRNLTLGQIETDLVLRLRLPFTGENGFSPQLVIPGFFTDTRSHQIVVVYDGAAVHFYLDEPQNVYHAELAPAMALFSYYPGVEIRQMPLPAGSMFILNLLYDAVLFVPLGAMLARLWPRLAGEQVVTAVAVIVVAVVTWEWAVSSLATGYALRLARILPAVAVGVAAYLIFLVWAQAWSQSPNIVSVKTERSQ